jgi:hypothetical protein
MYEMNGHEKIIDIAKAVHEIMDSLKDEYKKTCNMIIDHFLSI